MEKVSRDDGFGETFTALRGFFMKVSSREVKVSPEAEEIIVAHNHPSGDPTPSKADYDTTKKLKDGANLVGLELMDHLIIGAPESANCLGFVSLAELMAE